MSIEAELARLDRLAMTHGVPSDVYADPATTEEIRTLTDAVAPMRLPAEVIALYSWHNGCRLPFLAAYGLRTIAGLLEDRPFEINDLGAPPALLYLSDLPGGTGSRVGVTLDVPGEAPLPGVWSVDTHDQFAQLEYADLVSAVATFADMAEALEPAEDPVRFLFQTGPSPLPLTVDEYRLRRSPNAFRWPDPPVGTQISRFADPSWPSPWKRSLAYRSVDDDW